MGQSRAATRRTEHPPNVTTGEHLPYKKTGKEALESEAHTEELPEKLYGRQEQKGLSRGHWGSLW